MAGISSTTGISVATTADLNACLGEVDGKFGEHKKWCENMITDFVMKLRNMTERIDSTEREGSTTMETVNAELKSLRSGMVTNAAFRQQANLNEKRFEQEKEELDGKLETLKLAMEKEMSSGVGNLRLKSETLNANCIALTEKSRVLEETLIPQMKADLEEQKQKRLAETQRLEAEVEKMKELCEQKISHTAAALRFYVTATATKLREELAPLTMAKELEEDVKQKDHEAKQRFKSAEEAIVAIKAELNKHRGDLDSAFEKHTGEIGHHTKSLKVHEITVTNLQNSIASDINDIREQIRNERAGLQSEIADSRAASQRIVQGIDANVQAVVGEMSALRSFRELVIDRLHVEKVAAIVREWQTGHVPMMTSAVKDLEERVKTLSSKQQKDHDVQVELQRATAAIRGHFKMFHSIAVGLDDKPAPPPVEGGSMGSGPFGGDDTRLPQISGGRGQRTPD